MLNRRKRKLLCSIVTVAFIVSSTLPVYAIQNNKLSSSTKTNNVKKASGQYTGVKEIQSSKQNKQNSKTSDRALNENTNVAKSKSSTSSKAYANDEVIVKFKNGLGINNLEPELKTLKLEPSKHLGSTNAKLMKIKDGKSVEEVVSLLKKSKSIEYAEPNYKLYKTAVTDPRYNELWALKNTGQDINGYTGTAGIDINVEEAWTKSKGNSSMVVAVIDEGVDYNHPDLEDRIWTNPGEIADNNIDDDNNGYIDDIHGWDFFNDDNSVFDEYDGDAHGTHVSGTIAGTSNNVGVIGVAPNVKIMSLKFLGPDEGYTDDAIDAINYAKKMGIKLSNNSWGGGDYSYALYDAIENSGMLFVASAGNDGFDNDYWASYPASYDCPNIISVAAIDNNGYMPWWSNYGEESVDIAAPGVDVLSTVPKNSWDTDYSNAYAYYDGTSMAAPHVTGSAALVMSANPGRSAEDVKSMLLASSTKLSSLEGYVATGAMLNVGKAISYDLDSDIPGVNLTGDTVTGTLNADTDLDDVYAVSLKKGERLSLTLSGAAGTDFDLYLYDKYATTVNTSDNMLAYSETSGTSNETITFIPDSEGTYYIDLYGYAGSGSYTLNVKRGATPGVYEDDSEVLAYSNSIYYNNAWTKNSNSNASGGTYTSANTSSSSVEMIFNGVGIRYNALKDSKQGIAKVIIDGISHNVDLYSSTAQYKSKVFEKNDLEPGIHTLRIEWTGLANRNARKTSTWINVDSIQVLADEPPTAPKGLTGSVNSSNNAILNWTANTESDLQGYIVQRAAGESPSESDYQDISSTITSTTYTDTSLKLTSSYSYRVIAIDKNSNRSTPSDKVTLGEVVVRIEDNDSSITYTGAWTNATSSNYSGGTLKYINAASSSAEMQFTGTGIRYFAMKSPNYGNVDVYIDGVKVQRVNLFSSTSQYKQLVFEAKNLNAGNHTIKVLYTGTKDPLAKANSINVDAFEIITSASATIQDNETSITYAGTWTAASSSNYNGGTLKYINASSSSAEMKFTGTGIQYIAMKNPNYGNVDIYIDGTKVQRVNLYSSISKYNQIVYETNNLPIGNHTIKIAYTGTKDPLAKATSINLDAFVVTR